MKVEVDDEWECDQSSPTICDQRGNGIWTPEIGEKCDDGNRNDHDGCDRWMRIEYDWVCDDGSPTTCD